MRVQLAWLLLTLSVGGAEAFVSSVPRSGAAPLIVKAADGDEIAPMKKGIPLALLIWPLIAVGADIYTAQVQPRLADQGVETPALPTVKASYIKDK